MLEIYLKKLPSGGPEEWEEGDIAITRFPCIVGRHPECDVSLEDPLVSRRHCLFFTANDEVWVQDLNSSNGTYVNGERIDEARPLHQGDALWLAHLMFDVHLPLDLSLPAVKPGYALDVTVVIRRRQNVLVVDDNVDAADSLALVLQSWGHEVVVAYDGPGALEVAQNRVLDFALVDLRLPGMDGFQFAQKLRNQPGHERTTLAAMTGYSAAPEDRRFEDTGFHHVFTKPVDPEQLEKLLR
jgi:CheY-like chemotaxis protein